MNWFGKKKAPEPSTVSATSVAKPTDPQTTIVRLREAIGNQEKRCVPACSVSVSCVRTDNAS